MLRKFLPFAIVIVSAIAASAQEVRQPLPEADRAAEIYRPPVAAKKKQPEAPARVRAGEEVQYTIELMIVESSAVAGTSSDDTLPRRDHSTYLLDELKHLAQEKFAPPELAPSVKTAHVAPRDVVLPSPIAPPPTAPAAAASGDTLATSVPREPDLDIWGVLGRAQLPRSMNVLSAPRITVEARQTATVEMQSRQEFVYLEPLGAGKFEAKRTAPLPLGMKLSMSVEPHERDDDMIEVTTLEINVTALDGREPVTGLPLEAGKPIVSTRSLKTTATMELGATRVFPIPSGPSQEAVLLVRVRRWPLPEADAKK